MAKEELDIFLSVTEEEVRNISVKYGPDYQKAWDPVSPINLEEITNNSAKILARYEKLKKNPDIPRKQRKKGFVITGILLICTIPEIYFFGHGYFTFIFLILGFVIWGLITQYYKKLCIDLIKISIALEKNWFYDPLPNEDKWHSLRSKFPEVFRRGNKSQNVEDQFWGTFDHNNINYDFYAGIFNYVRETTDSKGKKSQTSYVKNFFL